MRSTFHSKPSSHSLPFTKRWLVLYKLPLTGIFSHILTEIRLKITFLTLLTMNVKFQRLMTKTVLVYALSTKQAHLIQVFFNTFNCSFMKEDVTELSIPTTLFTIYRPRVCPLVVISFSALKSPLPVCIEASDGSLEAERLFKTHLKTMENCKFQYYNIFPSVQIFSQTSEQPGLTSELVLLSERLDLSSPVAFSNLNYPVISCSHYLSTSFDCTTEGYQKFMC